MSLGEGLNVLAGRQRPAESLWTRATVWICVGATVSLLGYVGLFLALHLNSLGWAPGQVLAPFTGYWEIFYRAVFSQERVLAARRSALGASSPQLMIGAFMVIAAGYLLTIYALRALPAERQPRLRSLLGTALVHSVPLLILPNLLSGDIYSYISFGRIATLYAGNPFIDAPSSFRYDEYYRWVNWSNVPSVYGPAWIYPSMLLTTLVESVYPHVVTYLIAYKLLALLLHLANGALIWSILSRWKREQRAAGTALYLLNPLALIEFAGNAHNDVLMITLILLGVVAHLGDRWPWTVVAFTLAVLVKWIALPLLPLYGLLLLGRAATWRQRLRYSLGSLGIFAALSIGLYLPYWEGVSTLKVLVEAPPQKRLINSLGDLVVNEAQYGMYLLGRSPHPALGDFMPLTTRPSGRRELELIDGEEWRSRQRTRLQRYNRLQLGQRLEVLANERMLAAVARTAGLGLVVIACVAGAVITRNLRTLLLSSAWIFFTYTAIGAVWVWPWYATWFVALAALLDWRVTARTALLLSLTMLLLYPLFPALPEPPLVERYRALLVFGPPLLFAGFHLTRLTRSYLRGEWSLRGVGD